MSGSLGLLTKARGDREQLVAALYEAARYDGVVDILIQGKSIDVLPPDAEFGAGPVPVTISVTPGRVFTLGRVSSRAMPPIYRPTSSAWSRAGTPGQTRYSRRRRDIVRRLKSEGRPLAKITGRDIVADHDTACSTSPSKWRRGRSLAMAPTTVDGTVTVDSDFTAYMAGLPEGRTYSPEELDAARDRLTGLGVFNSVAVTEADALDQNGQIPINVTVTERKPRFFGLGATASNTEGLGIEGYWGHRNLFGRAEKLRVEGSISGIGSQSITELNYNAGIMFEKPGSSGRHRSLFPASRWCSSTRTRTTISRPRVVSGLHTN